MPGMRAVSVFDEVDEGHHPPGTVGVVYMSAGTVPGVELLDAEGGIEAVRQDFVLPDLDDPATLGCLLALVREAWGGAQVPESGRGRPGYDARRIYAEPHGDDWIVCWPNGQRLGSARTGSTEAEALVAALEAAP